MFQAAKYVQGCFCQHAADAYDSRDFGGPNRIVSPASGTQLSVVPVYVCTFLCSGRISGGVQLAAARLCAC